MKELIVITGPTASGKSALAVDTALRLGTEVISADSRQIYSGIPIVTAVLSMEERRGVPHHLLEFLPLDAYYSASLFERDALKAIADVLSRRDTAILCGGSMLYVDALCEGIDELPTVPPDVREALKERHRIEGDDWLLEELRRLDPACWHTVDHRNMRRVFHAVEVSLVAGRPYSSMLGKARARRPFSIRKIVIEMPRAELFGRINSRVDRMMEQGLLEEARKVYPLRGLNSLNTVGLKELFSCFDGEMDLTTAVERIKKNTRVFAKKQLTWLARRRNL